MTAHTEFLSLHKPFLPLKQICYHCTLKLGIIVSNISIKRGFGRVRRKNERGGGEKEWETWIKIGK